MPAFKCAGGNCAGEGLHFSAFSLFLFLNISIIHIGILQHKLVMTVINDLQLMDCIGVVPHNPVYLVNNDEHKLGVYTSFSAIIVLKN